MLKKLVFLLLFPAVLVSLEACRKSPLAPDDQDLPIMATINNPIPSPQPMPDAVSLPSGYVMARDFDRLWPQGNEIGIAVKLLSLGYVGRTNTVIYGFPGTPPLALGDCEKRPVCGEYSIEVRAVSPNISLENSYANVFWSDVVGEFKFEATISDVSKCTNEDGSVVAGCFIQDATVKSNGGRYSPYWDKHLFYLGVEVWGFVGRDKTLIHGQAWFPVGLFNPCALPGAVPGRHPLPEGQLFCPPVRVG